MIIIKSIWILILLILTGTILFMTGCICLYVIGHLISGFKEDK